MAIELITGVAGTAHVDSADVGAFNAAAYGNGSYIMKGGGCTMQNANTARVAASELLIQGRHVRITGNGEDAVIDNGNVGLNRNDLVCAKYVSSGGIESVTVAVLKGTAVSGTPADPTIPSGSIIAGDPEAWVPLYRVTINGLVPATPVRMISNADNIPLIDHKHSAADVTSGTLGVARGGTGASSAAAALTNLGAAASSHNHSASNITSGTLGVARGGTGVTANPSMLTNLASTSAASVFAASPRPGVTGALKIGNGGTGKTTAAEALDALGGASIKKLWTNSSPTSSFGAQTISLSLSGYDAVIIVVGISDKFSFFVPVGKYSECLNIDVASRYKRRATVNTSGIVFGAGAGVYSMNTEWTTSNSFTIPVYIYGVKGIS